MNQRLCKGKVLILREADSSSITGNTDPGVAPESTAGCDPTIYIKKSLHPFSWKPEKLLLGLYWLGKKRFIFQLRELYSARIKVGHSTCKAYIPNHTPSELSP